MVKGIVMHPKGLREATRRAMEREEHKQHIRLRPGEKKGCKRMATVVSVYEVDPYPRTTKSILGLEQPPERKRPRPENKRTWAWVEADQGTVIEQACAEAARRDPDQQMRWVVLTDGQPDLLRQVSAVAKHYPVDPVVVQDSVHVLEYLSERKPVDKAADYIDNNQERLQYDQALAYRLPIATGVIEGACRYLVKDRMDITGARWGLERAEAIFKLRLLKVSGNLAAYLTFHFEQKHKRHYPGPPIPLAECEAT